MAKQNKSTDPSEADVSVIEHALSLYGTGIAPADIAKLTVEDGSKASQGETPRLPQVEDRPLITPVISLNEEGAENAVSPKENISLEEEMDNLMKTEPRTVDTSKIEDDSTPSFTQGTSLKVEGRLPPPQTGQDKTEEKLFGIIPIKSPAERAKKAKTKDGLPEDAPRPNELEGAHRNGGALQPPELPPQLDWNGAEGGKTRRASVLPANDDSRSSIAMMLEPLNSKGSYAPMVFAALFSGIWLAGMLMILAQTDGLLFGSDGAWRPHATGMFVLSVLGIIGPILFFFSMAILSKRSREMRISAQVMAEVAARLAEPESTASESVFTLGQAVRREVASIGDGIERALSRAGDLESLVHGEVAALERSYAENEYKMRSLVGELSAEREAIMATAERIRLTIDAAHQGFAVDITKASSSISEAIDEAGDRVSFLIGGKQDEIVAVLDRNASHAAELISLRTHELTEKLGSATMQAEQMLAIHTQDMAEKIAAASHQTVNTFSRVGEDVISRLTHTGSTLTGEIENLSSLASTKLEEQSRLFIGEINTVSDALAARIKMANGEIVEEWESLSTHVTQAITQANVTAAKTFHATSEEATSAIIASLSGSTAALTNVGETLKQEFNGTVERLISSFDEKGQEIITNIGARAVDINEVVQSSGTEFFTKLEARGQEVATLIDTKAGSLVETISQRAEELAIRLHEDAEKLETIFSASTEQIENSITLGNDQLSSLFEAHQAGIASSLDTAHRQIGETLSRGSETLASNLSGRISQADELFSIAGESLGALISERTQVATKGLKAEIDDLGLTLMQQSAQVTQQLAASGRDLAEGMIAQANQVNEALSESTRQISTTLQTSAQGINTQLTQFETGLVEKTKALENNVLEHGKAIGNKLIDQSNTVSTTLTSLLDRIETGLDERAKSLGDVLALRTLELSRLITESGGRLEAVTTQSRETAEEAILRAETLARTVTAKVTEINTLFDESGTRFIKGLEGHGRDLLLGLESSVGAITTRLTISMAELNDAVASGSTASLTQLSEANDMLRNEVTILLDRLEEANTMLSSIVGNATEQLGNVEERMAERVDRLEKALSGILTAADEGGVAVLEKVEALRNSSSELLGSSTSLTSMLAERTDSLQTLATQLNATQQNVGDRLLERQAAFENLANTLSARIEDVDSMLRSFASLVTEQLSQAQQQARETSSLVLEASETATSTISAEYERVRQEADKERERTANVLRETYEQVNGEMSTLLQRALEDFSATAGQVREASADIIRDIEVTRRALETGGMDIPVQARQATTNLKRVLQEQMRAVSELGNIVTHSGMALDVAEPRRDEQVPRTAPRKPVPYAVEPATPMPESPRQPLYAAQPEPQATQPRYEARNPGLPLPGRNETPPPRGGNSGSWLSGMLERASSEEDRPSPPPLRNTPRTQEIPSSNRMEALDNLSIDIARMIDHEMAVDLWERYRRGERNIFTRRLYTLQGQDTYDEIRRRYRRDAEFRQTVDAYIQQFERLLAEVAGNDRDSSISRAYLTSETGKVYTMLAHAAGRFD